MLASIVPERGQVLWEADEDLLEDLRARVERSSHEFMEGHDRNVNVLRGILAVARMYSHLHDFG